MTKAIVERKHFVGSWLSVSEDESMVIMAGSSVAGRVLEKQVRVHPGLKAGHAMGF